MEFYLEQNYDEKKMCYDGEWREVEFNGTLSLVSLDSLVNTGLMFIGC